MKQLRYICAQPAIPYYAWQVEVMINNFIKNGVNPSSIDIVLWTSPATNLEKWKVMQDVYPDVGFHFYKDDRVAPTYVSSIRPNILKKHFAKFPELVHQAIFYHDCDIVLTQPPTWDKFLNDEVWYCSDTIPYVGARYIKSKKLNILQEMCDVVGVSVDKVDFEEQNSGGAQYIMKNVTSAFWDKVERDSEALMQYFNRKAAEYVNIPNYHPIQAWTADMWAVLWNAWHFGHTVNVPTEMDFCWPTDPIDKWNTHTIFHNSGVTGPNAGMFYKAQYTHVLPYDVQLDTFDVKRCSYRYVQEIVETSTRSCLL
jgi:hypothetical protein